MGGQRIAQLLCSASCNRPANRVSGNSQDQTEGGRTPMLERQHRVSRHAGKKSFGSFSLKASFSQAVRGLDTEEAESCQVPWMPRRTYGTQQIDVQAIPTLDQRRHELSISLLIRAELRRCRFD